MKKNIFKTLAVCCGFAVLLLTGCKNSFDGTTPNYNQKKEQFTGNYGENKSAKGLSNWSFSLSPSYDIVASDDLEIEVSFTASAELDYESVEAAFTFYKLKKNTKCERYYSEHDGEITKTLLHITEPNSYSGSVKFLYRLAAKNVTTNKIAFVVDATKLKYKNGLAVVSNDGNLTAGEVTDSFVRYLYVDYKDDGTTTDSLGYSYDESYTPNNYSITSLSYRTELTVSETDSTPSGKYRFECSAPSKTLDAEGYTSTYDDGLAELLSSKFKLQIQKPGSTKWEDGGKLEFKYYTEFSTAPHNSHSSYSYNTDVDTSVMEQGTKWRIMCDKSVKLGSPSAWVADAYGHAPYEYYPKVITKVYPYSEEYILKPYESKDTPIIFAYGTSETPGTFEKEDCVELSAFYTQNSFVQGINKGEKQIDVDFKAWMVELDKTDGFILVDSKNTIVPSTTTVHKNGDGKIDKVTIKPKNEKLNLYEDVYNVYVGSGTTIKSNPEYPKQLQFGYYPDLSKGDLSGYMQLVENLVQPGTSYANADDWNRDCDSAWVDEQCYGRNNEEDEWRNNFWYQRRVYLLAGKQYTIQMVNGNPSNPNRDYFLANHNQELCYYGELYVFPETEEPWKSTDYTKLMYNSMSYDLTFECTKTGYYYICINRNATASLTNPHYNDQYDPRYSEDVTSVDYNALRRDWYYDAYCNIDGSDITGNVSFEYEYTDDSDPDNPQTVTVPVTVSGPILFNFTPNWNGTEDGEYTGISIDYTHKEDESGNWLMNPNPKIPYRWGNVYYHLFCSTN